MLAHLYGISQLDLLDQVLRVSEPGPTSVVVNRDMLPAGTRLPPGNRAAIPTGPTNAP